MASSDVPMGRRMNGSEMLMVPNESGTCYPAPAPEPAKKALPHARWARDKILPHPGRAELLLCPGSSAAQPRRPTQDAKNFVLHACPVAKNTLIDLDLKRLVRVPTGDAALPFGEHLSKDLWTG
jgi:hypothetical protein